MRTRPGFAVIAAVVALAVVTLVGTVAVLPLMANALEQRAVVQAHAYLVRLTDVPKRGMQKFVEIHSRPPSQMVHLSVPIVAAPGACGTNYQATIDWEPQSDRMFVATGVPTPLGVISNTVARVGNAVMLEIPDVLVDHAERMDALVDSPTGATTGRVRWVVSDAAQALVTLRWVTPFTC